MAILNTWGNTNKVTSATLNVQFATEIAKIDSEGPIYCVRRVATKTYEYIGMDKATATLCLEAKRAQYFRAYAQYLLEGSTITPQYKYGCTTSVAVSWAGGSSYTCSINVNEDDVIYTRETTTTLEECRKLFAFADLRDYDEDNASAYGIGIATANFDAGSQFLSIYYQTNIPDFVADAEHLFVEYLNRASGQWETLDAVLTFETGCVKCTATERPKWRLRYSEEDEEDIVSNEVEAAEDPAKAALQITKCYFDPLLLEQLIEYNINNEKLVPRIVSRGMIVQYFDESSGTWKSVGNSSYKIRTIGYVSLSPISASPMTFRLFYSNGENNNYYSTGVLSDGDPMSAYTLTATSGQIAFGEGGSLYCDVEITTTIPTAYFCADYERLGATFVSGGANHIAFPTSFTRVTANKVIARFTNGQKGAVFTTGGTDTVTCWWGTISGGAHLAETTTLTPTVKTYSIAITSAQYRNDSTPYPSNKIVKLAVTTDVPDNVLSSVTVEVSSDGVTNFTPLTVVGGENGIIFAAVGSAQVSTDEYVRVKLGTSVSESVLFTQEQFTWTLVATEAIIDPIGETYARIKFNHAGIPSFDWTKLIVLTGPVDEPFDAEGGTPVSYDAETGVVTFTGVPFYSHASYGNQSVRLIYKPNNNFRISGTSCVGTYQIELKRAGITKNTQEPLELEIVANLTTESARQNLVVKYASTESGTYSTAEILEAEGGVVWAERITSGSFIKVEWNGVSSNVVKDDEAGALTGFALMNFHVNQDNPKQASSKISYSRIPNFDYNKLTFHGYAPPWGTIVPARYFDIAPDSYDSSTKTASFVSQTDFPRSDFMNAVHVSATYLISETYNVKLSTKQVKEW